MCAATTTITIDETVLYDRLTAGYLLGTGDKYARYYSAIAYTELMNQQSGKVMGIGVELGIDQTGYAKGDQGLRGLACTGGRYRGRATTSPPLTAPR